MSVAQAQKIEHIEAEVTGGKIQVNCTLQTPSLMDLSLFYSDNDGQAFNPCRTVSGDLLNQASGSKTILWDCGADGMIMGSFVFKVNCLPAANPPKENPEAPQTARRTETAPPDTASDPKTSERKTRLLLMPGAGIGAPLSGSLTVGFLSGHWGGYAKAKSNFASKGESQTGGQNDAYYDGNYSKTGRLSVSAGLMREVSPSVIVYAGVGYGNKWVQWKTTSDKLVEIEDLSFSGIEPEAGLMIKI
jgi:hypothetical protein